MNKIQTLVFDFDGTLVHSENEIFNILNKLAVKKGFSKIPAEEIPSYRDKSSREIISSLRIPLYKIPRIMESFRSGLQENILYQPLVDGFSDVLTKLRENRVQLGILTSNSALNIEKYLIHHQINMIDFIYAGSSLFGKDKVINKLIQERQLDKKTTVYVGDETRDVEGAKKAGLKIISVSWGFNSRIALEKYHPDWVIDHPNQILDIINLK